MDPAGTGLEIIQWYQDFMTNPTSRAQQISASHHFFHSTPAHATAQIHTSAPAPVHALASAHASASILDKPSMDTFWGNLPCLQSAPTEKATFLTMFWLPVLMLLTAAWGFIFTAVQRIRTMPAHSPSSSGDSPANMRWIIHFNGMADNCSCSFFGGRHLPVVLSRRPSQHLPVVLSQWPSRHLPVVLSQQPGQHLPVVPSRRPGRHLPVVPIQWPSRHLPVVSSWRSRRHLFLIHGWRSNQHQFLFLSQRPSQVLSQPLGRRSIRVLSQLLNKLHFFSPQVNLLAICWETLPGKDKLRIPTTCRISGSSSLSMPTKPQLSVLLLSRSWNCSRRSNLQQPFLQCSAATICFLPIMWLTNAASPMLEMSKDFMQSLQFAHPCSATFSSQILNLV